MYKWKVRRSSVACLLVASSVVPRICFDENIASQDSQLGSFARFASLRKSLYFLYSLIYVYCSVGAASSGQFFASPSCLSTNDSAAAALVEFCEPMPHTLVDPAGPGDAWDSYNYHPVPGTPRVTAIAASTFTIGLVSVVGYRRMLCLCVLHAGARSH